MTGERLENADWTATFLPHLTMGYRQILRRRSKTIVISSKTATAVRYLTQVKIADPVYFERICGGSLQNAADEVDEGSLEWMCGLEKQ
jgi:hypothetical protein